MIGLGIPGLGLFSEKACKGNLVFATFFFSVATMGLMFRTGCLKVLGLCGASGVLDFSTFILLGDGEAIPTRLYILLLNPYKLPNFLTKFPIEPEVNLSCWRLRPLHEGRFQKTVIIITLVLYMKKFYGLKFSKSTLEQRKKIIETVIICNN